MNTQDKENVYNALLKIRDDGPVSTTNGICFSIGCIITKNALANNIRESAIAVDFVTEYSEGWPYHSGHSCYPVPVQYTPDADSEPPRGHSFWDGEEGKLRTSLLNYLIDKLGKELGK